MKIVKINGVWCTGRKFNYVFLGESAEVLNMLEKYGALK
jgi:hypothetical protein